MHFKKPQPIRLVLADTYTVFRNGLRRLLESEPNHRVIGEASSGAEAVKLAYQLKPEILLLESCLPMELSESVVRHSCSTHRTYRCSCGIEVLRELSTPGNAPPVRSVLLTAAIEKTQIVEALQVGAKGVVLKDSATKVLLKAIQAVMADEYWLLREPFSDLESLRPLMQRMHEEEGQKLSGLTLGELRIVSAVVAGYSNKEIAEYFKIGEDTVKQRLRHVFDKVGVSTRLELALFAVNQGLPLKHIEEPPADSPHKPAVQSGRVETPAPTSSTERKDERDVKQQ